MHPCRVPSKVTSLHRWLIAAALTFTPYLMAGQAAPAGQPAKTATGDDEAVMLSPFMVETTQDRGYQAMSTLGGSRLKTNLKDVASPTSAFTEQFLRDLGLTNLEELAPYMLSTELEFNEDIGGNARLAGNAGVQETSRSMRMRGLSGGTVSVNFFKSPTVRFDTFNTERIDQSRGPNSVLFGVGNPGGSINVSTKRAVVGDQRGSLALTGRSYDGWRYELDANQPIVRNRLAVRIVTAKEDTSTWKDFEYDQSERYYGTLKWRPLPRTELNLDVEDSSIDRKTDQPYVAGDDYTLWASLGRVISATGGAATGQSSSGATTGLVFDSNAGTLADWRNRTYGARRVSVDGQAVALRDFSVLPRQTSIRGPGTYVRQNYHRMSAFLTHSFPGNIDLEVGATRTDEHYNNSRDDEDALRVDTSPLLPTGVANPNAGRAFLQGTASRRFRDSRTDGARAMLAYRLDAGRWGKHLLAGGYEFNFYKEAFVVVGDYVISPNAPNLSMPEHTQNAISYRTVASQLARVDVADYTTHVVADGRRPQGQIQRKANLRTNYEFTTERLKGFSIGGGFRYFGRPVIGYYASGTATTGVKRLLFEGPEQVFLDLSAGYRRRLSEILGRKVQWSLQLNVNNALNNDDLVPIRRASDGELVFYRFNAPRSWMLTNRFMF